jgi:TetR/AcrR family transcriptional regulator
MKPRRRPERGNVRRRILGAATALFAANGPHGTAVDDVVRRAGCNKRMVYHYFGSKEGLYRAVLWETYQSIRAFEERVVRLHRRAPAREFVERLVRSYLRFHKTHPRFVNLLAWENLHQGRSIRHLPVRATKSAVLEGLEEHFRASGIALGRSEMHQFFLSLSALCFFTFSNRHTMRAILGYDPAAPPHLPRRLAHVATLLNSSQILASE